MSERRRTPAGAGRSAELEKARRDGYLVLRYTPGPTIAEALREGVAKLVLEAGPELDASGGTVYLPGLLDDPVLASCASDDTLAEAVSFMLGQDPVLIDVRYRSPKPGGGAQTLHRDQPWPHPDGRWSAATVIVGLTEFSAINGATRLVPGSHLDRRPWTGVGPTHRHPGEIHLTGPPGSAYIFTGACLHSGTANRSTAPRPGIQLTYGACTAP